MHIQLDPGPGLRLSLLWGALTACGPRDLTHFAGLGCFAGRKGAEVFWGWFRVSVTPDPRASVGPKLTS